jgi:AcrR family transcriptional regulator
MTSRFERRLAQIQKLQRLIPEPPPDPRMFVIATLVGFHCCPRRDDEHPLKACAAVARGSSGDADAALQRQFDDFLAAHRVNLDAEPTPDGLRALQRLLDGVPERWRDAEMAWWPACATEMWSAPVHSRSSAEGSARYSS